MKAEWLAWSKLLVPRLGTDENAVRVGEPPRRANGLPRGLRSGNPSPLHQEELEEGNLQTRRKSMVGRKLIKQIPGTSIVLSGGLECGVFLCK